MTPSGYNTALGDKCAPVACSSVSFSLSGNTLFVSGVFPGGATPTSNYNLQLTVYNIKNPGSLSVSNFVMTVYKSGTIYYSLPFPTPSFSTSSLTYSVSVLQPSIWTNTPYTFTLVPDVLIESLMFTFPSPWDNEIVFFNTLLSGATCSSNSNPNIVCTSFGPMMQITNLSYYHVGTPIDITINLVANPSSIASIGTITITGQFSGSDVTSADIVVPSTNFKNDILRNINFTVSYQSNDQITVIIFFSISHTSMSSDVFELAFPA